VPASENKVARLSTAAAKKRIGGRDVRLLFDLGIVEIRLGSMALSIAKKASRAR
jgi:hypothetical protein